MHRFLNKAFTRLTFLLVFTGFFASSQSPLLAQRASKEQLNILLDSLDEALYEFNYFDSLNNKPLFFSFPYVAKQISVQADEDDLSETYYRAEHIRARYYSYNDVVAKVFDIYDSAINRAKAKGDLLNEARFIFYKGNENSRNDWYDAALRFYNETYNRADSLGFERLKASVLNSLARTYAQMRQDENAITYYRKAQNMALAIGDSIMINTTMSNLGIAYGRLGYGDSAIFYGQKCYEMASKINDKIGLRKGLNALIMGSQLKGNHQQVLSLTDEMYALIELSGDVGYMITPLLNRSKSHWALGNPREALKDADESFTTAKMVGFVNGQTNAMEWKIELLEGMGDYKSALALSGRLRQFSDSVYQYETKERLASMSQSFEIRERESRIESLVQVNEANSRRLLFRNLAIVALIMVFLVLVILLLLINRRKLEKEKYALQEAQDKLLRSQLNPHFLFNALSSIQLFLINKGQGREALEYLSKFAKLMRRILENSRESMVSLEDEISTLRHYLDLQKIRFDHKFEYKISVETEKDTSDIMIPPMFAQPFIENSLEHGISHRDDGMIRLWFKETEDGLSFKVEDNGVGISRSTKTEKQQSHKSLATIITRDRINILRRQLKKRIQFDIRDKMNEQEEVTGTEVVFELPVIYR